MPHREDDKDDEFQHLPIKPAETKIAGVVYVDTVWVVDGACSTYNSAATSSSLAATSVGGRAS